MSTVFVDIIRLAKFGGRQRDVCARLQGRPRRRGVEGARQPLCVGRGNDWVRKTCGQRETLTIAGFALDGNEWDGIYVGRRKGNDLIDAGKVDHGFDNKSFADRRKRLTPLIRKTSLTPGASRIKHLGRAEFNAEIDYRVKSAAGKVRHSSSGACGRICGWRLLLGNSLWRFLLKCRHVSQTQEVSQMEQNIALACFLVWKHHAPVTAPSHGSYR